jgi:integrase
MKRRREHAIPLSDAALALLKELAEIRDGDYLFPSDVRRDRPITKRGVHKMLLRLDIPASVATPHGFRSSFKDWATARRYDWVVVEISMAHIVGNAVTQAYLRDQLIEERRPLMQAWGNFVTGVDNVIDLAARRTARHHTSQCCSR